MQQCGVNAACLWLALAIRWTKLVVAKFTLCAAVKSKTLEDVRVRVNRRLGIQVNIKPPHPFHLSLSSSFNFPLQ